MRRAAKRDATEAAIVEALFMTGWTVDRLSAKDLPDLLCSRRGVTQLCEVKTGTGKLRPGQIKWHQRWQGRPVAVLRTVEDALALGDQGYSA